MEGVAAEARPAAVPAYEEALDWGYEEPEEEKEKDAVVVSPPEPVDSKVGGEAGLWTGSRERLWCRGSSQVCVCVK